MSGVVVLRPDEHSTTNKNRRGTEMSGVTQLRPDEHRKLTEIDRRDRNEWCCSAKAR